MLRKVNSMDFVAQLNYMHSSINDINIQLQESEKRAENAENEAQLRLETIENLKKLHQQSISVCIYVFLF